MPDESLLDGLDPFDLLDRESERVDEWLRSDLDWSRPSRCAGWSTRDMLGHLMGLEDYVRANLDGNVKELQGRAHAEGVHGVGGFNDWQIAAYADVAIPELIDRWHEANLAGRAELRARGRDGVVDTSIGDYPSWLQTFHFAVEYATHGDDVFVYVDPADADERTLWRIRFGSFVLGELEKPVEVELGVDSVLVRGEPGELELSGEDFVEATQGRLPEDHPLSAGWRKLLVTVP
jgi:uncharacterized protein (TIGR03083 family)